VATVDRRQHRHASRHQDRHERRRLLTLPSLRPGTLRMTLESRFREPSAR
jgi:hypothetical protein